MLTGNPGGHDGRGAALPRPRALGLSSPTSSSSATRSAQARTWMDVPAGRDGAVGAGRLPLPRRSPRALGGGKDGDRGDSFADEALRTLLTETENNRTSLCVVLAGYREAMAGPLRADPGSSAASPRRSTSRTMPAELAAIARRTARDRFGSPTVGAHRGAH